MTLTTRRLTVAFAVCLGLAPATATAAWTHSTVTGAAVGGAPHVAVNAEGAAVVAWASQAGVLRAGLRRAGGRFGPVRVLRRAPAGALHDPDVAVDRAGTAYVTWAEVARTAPRYRVMVATAPRAGRFGRPIVLGGAESVRRAHPEVVLGPAAGTFVAWRRDHTGFVLAQRLAGARFGSPRAPFGLPLPDVDLAIAPDGRLHLLWTAAGPGGPFIAATRGRLTRSFAVPAAVSEAGRSAPVLQAAANGALVAAWVAGAVSEAGAPRGPVEAATARVGFGSWLAPQRVSPPGADGVHPRLAVGPHAEAAVAWSAADPGAQRGVAWVATRRAGGSFAPAEALTPPASALGAPAVAVDGTGAVTAAAVDDAGGTTVLELRRGPAGTPLPPAARRLQGGPPATPQAGTGWSALAAAAAGPHTLVAWSHGTQARMEILAHRP